MRYTVVRRLGRGGMGVVDLAVDPDGTEVALKRLSLHGTPEEVARARARIRREAEVLRSLDHPGIVPLLDLVDDGDDVVLVMPYLSGGSLHERVVTSGRLDADAVVALADPLLDALAAAHRQGVVHRDIKPENVLFTADGEPRLVDFGVARATDHTPGLTATSMVVGTPAFMAPEQARGEEATAASDVFSLGATLLFALTGEGPFGPPSADPRVLMHRAAAGRVDRIPRDVPVGLRTLLVGALERQAARRPSAARLRGGPEGTSPLTGLAGAVRRNRALAGLGAGVVILLLVAGAVAALTGGDDDRAGERRGGTGTTTTTTGATTTTEACEPLAFQPCEDGELADPAPNTDGRRCLEGYEDYDERPTNGCEAEPDDLDDPQVLTESQREVQGTIVPVDDTDRFRLPTTDDVDLTCSGRITVTLIAPEGMVLELTVTRSDGETVATALAEHGDRAVTRIGERCAPLAGDGDLTVTVRPVGSDRVAAPYTLRREGSF